MASLDITIVSVAIARLRGGLSATLQEITWVTTGFLVGLIVVVPLAGFLGKQFGQKRVYLCALALFVISSILCGMAQSLTALVVFRVLQGLAAGGLQPSELAILRQTFPADEQGMAMAVYAIGVYIGPAAGPILGGYIIDQYSWPWIFYINVPIGILALAMVWRFVDEPKDIREENARAAVVRRKDLDWLGIVLLTVGAASLVFVLEEGVRRDWLESSAIRLFAATAVVSIGAFVWRELTARVPAVDLALFKDTTFLAGTLMGAVTWAVIEGVMFLLPVFMQELLGFSATQAGLTMVPRAIVVMVATLAVGRLYNRVSPRLCIAIGLALFALASYQMSQYTLHTARVGIAYGLVIQGIALGCIIVPLSTLTMSRIPRVKLADAAGLEESIRLFGSSAGLAMVGTLVTWYSAAARSGIHAHLASGRLEVAHRLTALHDFAVTRGYDPASAQAVALRVLDSVVVEQSTLLAFQKLFLIGSALSLCILPLTIFLRAGKTVVPAPSGHEDQSLEPARA
jgi:DHA2 family multidrug resistance protein